MKAVIVGSMGDRKLYYILDATEGQEDGAVVTSDGRVIMVNFFSLAMKTSGLKRITNTPFHRFLWDAPSGDLKKIWADTFIKKLRPIDKRFTETLIIKSSLGKNKNDIKEKRIKSFLQDLHERKNKDNKFSKINTKDINTEEQGLP